MKKALLVLGGVLLCFVCYAFGLWRSESRRIRVRKDVTALTRAMANAKGANEEMARFLPEKLTGLVVLENGAEFVGKMVDDQSVEECLRLSSMDPREGGLKDAWGVPYTIAVAWEDPKQGTFRVAVVSVGWGGMIAPPPHLWHVWRK